MSVRGNAKKIVSLQKTKFVLVCFLSPNWKIGESLFIEIGRSQRVYSGLIERKPNRRQKERMKKDESSGVKEMERQLEKAKKEEISDDLMKEILKRLPLKSAARFCTVSTDWLRMISQITYVEPHIHGNFLFTHHLLNRPYSRWFHWTAQEAAIMEMENQEGLRYSQLISDHALFTSEAVRGLIICHSESEILLCNPVLRKYLNLPSIPTSVYYCYLGFEPITGSFMVLGVSYDGGGFVPGDIQLLTLMEGEEWKPLSCNHRYRVWANLAEPLHHYAVCLGGKIYYAVRVIPKPDCALMSFDLHSKTFTVIPFPDEFVRLSCEIIKFQGKIAVVPSSEIYGYFDLWVLDDLKTQTWVKHTISINGWSDHVYGRDDGINWDDRRYHCRGTISTDELIFASNRLFHGAVHLLCYNMEDEYLKLIKIEGVGSEDDDYEYRVETLLDYIEEPYLLPGGTKDFYRRMGNKFSSKGCEKKKED